MVLSRLFTVKDELGAWLVEIGKTPIRWLLLSSCVFTTLHASSKPERKG